MNKLTHDQIAELVVKAQKGDDEAFAALYTATVDRQLCFALSFLKDSALAEDVVQEVYIKMFKNIKKLENPKVFVAYLNRICYNTCVDYKNKSGIQKMELNADKLETVKDLSKEGAPDDFFEYKETGNRLYDAIGQLPEQQRSAFMLRYYHHLRVREISQTMNISESTVKRSIKGAVEDLRMRLATIEG